MNPFGETVFARQRLTASLPSEAHKAIIAASLSDSPTLALEATQQARSSSDPVVRYAAAVATAYVIAKADPTAHRARLRMLVGELRRDARHVSFSTGDTDYLEAVLAWSDGKAQASLGALDAALAKEPAFVAAAMLATQVQLRGMRVRERSAALCEAGYRRLFSYIARLMDAKPCPRQAAFAETFLRRQVAEAAAGPAFLSTQLYLAIVARRPDHAQRIADGFDGVGEFSCKPFVARQLRALIVQTADLMAR